MPLKRIKALHLNGHKEISTASPIKEYLNPEYVYIPLITQSTVCDKLVNVGDYVYKGQKVCVRNDRFQHALHSPVSGKVTAFKKMWHASGKMVEMIEIQNDFEEKLDPSIKGLTNLTKQTIIEAVKNAGVVGLGGSGFPTYIKYLPETPAEIVIINAAECEPYITADYMLIKEEADKLLRGITYIMTATGAPKATIAIKKNKYEAIDVLKEAIQEYEGITISLVKDVYPAGWEKFLVHKVVGKDYDRLPSEVGAVVNNVQTAIAVCEAVEEGKPLIEKVVTLTGDGIKEPQNFRVKIGTKISDLVDLAGGYIDEEKPTYLIAGGPMTGKSIVFDDLVINNCLGSVIVKIKDERENNPECLGCGKCAEVCPVYLTPIEIKRTLDNKDTVYLKALSAEQCIECGLCSYICPSRIELTDATSKAKALVLKG
ncbi:MAG: RnfABCDGE type electron transport complex subunit C [Bacilli bacterium]|jgi:electron transport complex protein RnfC